MKLGIIIETRQDEKVWNAFRFATTARKKGHEVKVFLLGDGVECEEISNNRFDIESQIMDFYEADGIIYACGSCITLREMDISEIFIISTMVECVELVEWADKTLTF